MKGYLEVPGNWFSKKNRWVVLNSTTILCYTDNTCRDLKEKLDLDTYTQVCNSTNGKQGQFELISKYDGTKKEFIASSIDNRTEWLNKIESAQQSISNYNASHNSDETNNDGEIEDIKYNDQWISSSLPPHKFSYSKPIISNNDKSPSLSPAPSSVSVHNVIEMIQQKHHEKMEDKEQQIKALENQLDLNNKNIKQYKRKISQLESDDKEKQQSLHNKNNELQNKQNRIVTLRTQLQQKDTDLQQTNNEKTQIQQRETGNDERKKLLDGKKGWLTFLTVIISMCSLFSSLGLSKFFGTSDVWNGWIAIGTSVLSLLMTGVKFSIAHYTFNKHKSNYNGIQHNTNDDATRRRNKDWISHKLLMKALYVTISTINDCTFDVLQGLAAIFGEPYAYSTFVVLLAATWFGVIEEFGELVVEIFFDTNECECGCCSPVKSYSCLLIWSYVESVVGIYLLITYDNDILKFIGIAFELLLGNIIVISVYKFYHWSNTYNPQ
eukprot:532706_1